MADSQQSPVKDDAQVEKLKDKVARLQKKIYDLESNMDAVVKVKTDELQRDNLELTKRLSVLTDSNQVPSHSANESPEKASPEKRNRRDRASPDKGTDSEKNERKIRNLVDKLRAYENDMDALVYCKTQELQVQIVELKNKLAAQEASGNQPVPQADP